MNEAAEKANSQVEARMELAYRACMGIPDAALERLAEKGGVRALWKVARDWRQASKIEDLRPTTHSLLDILDAIGPLEGDDE